MHNVADNYRYIIDQIEDYAILLLDENGIIQDWNKGAEKIKGYKAKEIIGKNFRVFYTAPDRKSKLPEQLIAKAIANGKASYEGWRVRKDGNTFWGSILLTALFDKEDKLTGFMKITRDLSDKKELEEKLRKLNEGLEQQIKEHTAELQKQLKEISYYKFAIDESSIVATTDTNGIIIHANDNFCKTSKYTQAELIGQDHRIVNSGYHSKEFMRHLWETIANGKIWKGEIKNKAKDGTFYWVDTTIVPFLNEDGKPSRYIAIRADITQQKEAKERLIASEQQFRHVLENMLEGVQLIDFNWRYIYVNNALTKYSYHTKEQLIGYTVMEKYPGIEKTELFKTLKQCMEERTTHHLESELVFPDGSKKDFELSIQPVPEGIFILSIDITDRKKAEKTEYELHTRLKAIFDKTNDAIMLADDSGNYVQVNPAAAKMLGYSEQELTGMNAAEIVSQGQTDELWNEFMQDGRQSGAIELIRKNGGRIICHYNATTNILPGLHLSILTDVTEQKKAEHNLIESEKKYRLLFQNNPLPMWMLELPSYKIVDVNDAAVLHYGYTRAEFLSMNARDLRPKEDVPMFEKQIVAVDREGTHQAGKWRHKKKNGETIIADIVTHDIKLEGENILIVLANDVTERERAEEKLRENEERYRSVIAVSNTGAWEYNLDTGEIWCSPEYLTMLGLTSDDFSKVTLEGIWIALLHPDDREDAINRFSDYLKSGSLGTYESYFRMKHKNGGWLWFWSRGKRLRDANDQLTNLTLGVLIDITELKKAEEELQRSHEDIQQLNAHLQTVREEERAHISRELHDELGQQLTGIKMDMVWMSNKLANPGGSTTTRVAEALQLVDETANTLRRITADLRPEILEDLGLYAALDWYCDEFTKRTGIECSVEDDGDEPEIEENIRINIFRIFQEALNNVAKHAHATQVKALIKIANGKLELTVTDNGKGFDKGLAKNKKTYGLLGMKERVVAIHGELQIESAIGNGTRIHATIPLNNQPTSP